LTNITNTIQDQVVLTMSRLKLKASNQQYFITIQFRLELTTWFDQSYHWSTNV